MTEIQEIKKIIQDHEKRISKLESSHNAPKPTQKQKAKARKSTRDLLIILKNEGFFKAPRRLSDMVARLVEKNYNVSYGDLTKPLAKLVQSETLERKKIDKKWAYLAR
jgi:hypothetical protein